uniref:Uncharacterized protein n=1 Tax=viral metagenome TaxID=1070528 RepID=A0A6C0B3Q9_9ZZZZ
MSKGVYLENLATSKYERPTGGTLTSQLQTKEAMKEKLKKYERADSVDDIELDRHVRYITLDKQHKQVFRTGGLLIRKENAYVQLSNGRQKWSVQRYHYKDDGEEPIFETVFFYRITLKQEFEKKEEKYIDVIRRQRDEIKKLKKIIKLLKVDAR